MDKFKKKDSRIKVFSNYKNLGLTKSLNILIKESKGSLIFRQDSDDISLPNRLMKQVDLLRHPNNHACVTRAVNSLTLKKIPNMSYNLPYKLVMNLKIHLYMELLESKEKFYMMLACMMKNFIMHKIITYIKN